jgi:hypothetical protein
VLEQLDRGPKQLKARQQFAQQKQTELEAQREKLKRLKATADEHGLQLKSNEGKIAVLKGKLNAASSNREFDAIKSQIEADSVANSVLEDEILELLEKVDQGRAAVGKLEQEVAAAKAEETRLAAEIAATDAGLRVQASELEAAISQAEGILPADVKVVYRRLVQAYGSEAFSEVEGNICSFCYVQVPSQMLMELKGGKIMFCKTCGRLMYVGAKK